MRIQVEHDKKFILRTAGIFMHEGRVLLHRAEHEDLWALPGGGCEFFEDTKTALIRELEEEIEASIEVDQLVYVAENYFEWNGSKAHEIGFYFLARFSNASMRFYDLKEFKGIERKMDGMTTFKLIFQWFPIEVLDKMNLKPEFLKSQLTGCHRTFKHIVNRSAPFQNVSKTSNSSEKR
ncbi:MAG: NUDIX domain-containing protein [Proteobacteria bacterium]|nr:NUDIX domain-containing protein [Pseudomonadota bacterium]